jgi:putative two-component system response regulator
VSDKVYRKGLSHEEVCAIIRNGSGTEFDPRVVDAFEKVCEKFVAIRGSADQMEDEHGWSFVYETNTGS